MEVKKKEGRMEYWSIGAMEYWKEEKTAAFAKATAWQGRKNEKHWDSGRLEGWGKEIPPGLPLRHAQGESLYKREEIGEKDGTNVAARRKGA
jgi:hypothetical protein